MRFLTLLAILAVGVAAYGQRAIQPRVTPAGQSVAATTPQARLLPTMQEVQIAAPPTIHAYIDARTGQMTLGDPGTPRAEVTTYDNTTNYSGYIGGNVPVGTALGDDLIMTGVGELRSISMSLRNGSTTGYLVSADLEIEIRDPAFPDVVGYALTFTGLDFTFGGQFPTGIAPNSGVLFTVGNLASFGATVPQAILVGYKVSNVSGGANPPMDKTWQYLYDLPTVGFSDDVYWDTGGTSGAMQFWWFGGIPRASYYYKVTLENFDPLPNPVYSNTASQTIGLPLSSNPADPNAHETIFDDLFTTGAGYLSKVEFSLLNFGDPAAGDPNLVSVQADLIFRNWGANPNDPNSFDYFPAGQFTVQIDFDPNDPLPPGGYGVVVTLNTIPTAIPLTTNVLAGIKFHDPVPANVGDLGIQFDNPPTVGYSNDVFRVESVANSGWYYFPGGSPISNFYWVLETSPTPPICIGDMNCDGVVDFKDINPFVAILSGTAPCNFNNADVNGDGAIDFKDINPFVAVLASGATCP
jgi:hypothetical protein